MTARKKRPVLYEVVARSQRTRGWTTAPRPTAPPPSTSPPPAARPEPTRGPQPTADAPASAAAVRVADGRVHLTLSWLHVTMLGVLLLVVLVATFHAGQRSNQSPVQRPTGLEAILGGQPEAERADAEFGEPRPEPRPAGGGAATPLRPAGTERSSDGPRTVERPPVPELRPPPPFDFEPDRYYVAAQYFPKSRREAAEAAREFLQSKGVDCVVHERRGDLALVATEAFATQQAAQRLQHAIRTLGKEYFPIGGYDFAGCEPVKF